MDDIDICMICAFITDCNIKKITSACETNECVDFFDISLLPPEENIEYPEQYEIKTVKGE